MKKILAVILFFGVATSMLSAQANAPWNTNNYKKLILNPNSAYTKDNIKKRKPVVLPPIREADAVWSKLVWRVIDVREKMNQHFYFPQSPTTQRKNLMNILLEGIQNQGLTAYDVNDDEFTTPISYQDIMKKLDAGEQTIQVRNQLTGELEEQTVASQGTGTSEVLQFMLKEQWYFDKNSSRLQVRIIGICPIRVYEKQADYVQPLDEDPESTIAYEDELQDAKLRQQLFWVYFNEARPILATQEAFNRKNDSHRLSYDDIFIKRYFSSFITQYSNVYDNRAIADYTTGIDQIIESERIKEEILRFENDLWEY
ncbi:protein involved in gliding motility GldN [Balneicella halophila]|uniref:Protein involved in gliding motility GldN n=1 Tax=Balneicella halophila TaxID=1537566 RepID=A0A7L4UQQ7_BALHA|nr:gliding motility protein GldN [Balneicella halophila]PVX52108.1 protein involved in gliding motility GldN [Balneicella halophila]